MRYFEHDVDASADDKIMALRIEHGGAAVDAYWTVLEMIYRDESDVVVSCNRPETKSLCHRLCIDYEKLSEWLSEMASLGLLTVHDDVDERGERVEVYGSTRASANIERYEARKETARENGKKGGGSLSGAELKPSRSRTGTKLEPSRKPMVTRPLTQPETKERKKEYLKIFLITP